MQISEHVSLDSHTTLNLGGTARYFTTLQNTSDLQSVFSFAEEYGLPVFFLGAGSNSFFADGVINKFVVKNELRGISFKDEGNTILAKAAAGEDWDEFVAKTVDRDLSGLEALSGIPGTVGAAPVQNIGAYGSELSDSLVFVTAWDTQKEGWRNFTKSDCRFSYRDSFFKRQPDRFLITEATFRLKKEAPKVPQYPSLQKHLQNEGIANPDIQEIRRAILAVRSSRLPDITQAYNAGSFFTNPVISSDTASALSKQFPDIVQYELPDGRVKIPAGWLIEQAGLKGESFGNFRTSPDNALVLIHNGEGTTSELLMVEEKIRNKIHDMFGIILEREPNFVR